MKYRKKPVVIEAFRFGFDAQPDWFSEKLTNNEIITIGQYRGERCADIKTLEGTMRADHGDWIIQGIKGEVYPCKPEIFVALYELE